MAKINPALGYQHCLERVLISETELQKRISQLAVQIDQDYAGKQLILICILRGGVVFLTDLMRKLTLPHQIDFMSVSSYGVGARSTNGSPRIVLDLNTDIRDRDVLLVEDIVDSGVTLDYVLRLLKTREPASLEVCVLLDKEDRRKVEIRPRYVGFKIPNEYVFGFGLDLDEVFRNLPFIGVLKAEYQ
ncbi:MAG TPA: hypoxanthine phosphoribosyltransferase [Anaerolineae bacterium]